MKYLKKVETLPSTLEEGVLYYSSTEDKVAIKPKPQGPEMVDLGLSVKWAKWNVGATNETEGGKYFMWGDVEGGLVEGTTTTSIYNLVNAPYQTNIAADTFSTKWTKYLGSTTSSYKDTSATDEDALKTVLDPSDDAATVAYGEGYRMPTVNELYELTANTTSAFTSIDGVQGLKLTSKKEGYTNKYVFFPAVGNCYNSSVYNVGSYGYVWSNCLGYNGPNNAYHLNFGSSYMGVGAYIRCYGYSVRAVSKN